MKKLLVLSMMALLVGAAAPIKADNENDRTLVVTSSNAATNELLVFGTAGALIQRVATGGQGGVGGNAGGIAVDKRTVAVVNFGSQSVSILTRLGDGFALSQTIATSSAPVSVAFGKDHLYVLGTTAVESHRFDGGTIDAAADGIGALVRGDGSAAQVGVVGDQLVISEKSGVIEVVDVRGGAVAGAAEPVEIPADSDTPFGLVTRGEKGYVTIAHSDEISLIEHERLIALTAIGSSFPSGPGQQAPCWITVIGPYLFTSNSPSHSLSRLIATGDRILIDLPVAARTGGAPTDIAAAPQLLAVVESDGPGQSHLTQWTIGEDGTLSHAVSTAIPNAANGVAIVGR